MRQLQLSCQVTCRFELKFYNISGPDPDNGTTIGVSVGVPVLVLLLVALVVIVRQRVVITRQRKKRKQEEEKEKAEINPVYGTYEIHDDPVAEVKHQLTLI